MWKSVRSDGRIGRTCVNIHGIRRGGEPRRGNDGSRPRIWGGGGSGGRPCEEALLVVRGAAVDSTAMSVLGAGEGQVMGCVTWQSQSFQGVWAWECRKKRQQPGR